jgi:formamidopyrimidine-DNA glycosylase
MPELPEVETMRRGILTAIGGRIVGAARVRCLRRPITITPKLPAIQRRLVGQTIAEIGRLGKRVVIHVASGDALILEPRMTGLVLVADPPSQEHLRFRLDLAESPIPTIWYWDRRGLGSVRLLSAAELDEQLVGGRLGPDALVLSAAELAARLKTSKRAIKVALLDQRALAGVGNLYASEILHLARVHPARRCYALTAGQWREIHQRMQEILQDAIAHEGSTLSDGTYRNALSEAGGYQNLHRVYDRAGDLCRQCGRTPIRRIVQAQRSTFYCPICQRSGRP